MGDKLKVRKDKRPDGRVVNRYIGPGRIKQVDPLGKGAAREAGRKLQTRGQRIDDAVDKAVRGYKNGGAVKKPAGYKNGGIAKKQRKC